MSKVESIVFGVRVEKDMNPQRILDKISDRFENDGFDESDWNFIAWELHGVVYVVFQGSYLLRASLLKIKFVERVEPLLEVTSTIKSNKSKWLYPSRKIKGTPIIETATKRLDSWIREQFPQDTSDQKALDTILGRSATGEAPKFVSNRNRPTKTPAKVGAVSSLLAVISGGASEDGEKFDVFSFDDKAPGVE